MATKPTPKDATTPAPVSPTSDDSKITVRSSPMVKARAEDPSKSDLTVHHELTITPLSQAAKEPTKATEPVAEAKPLETVEPPSTSTPAEPVKAVDPPPLQSPEPPTDDAPKTEPKPTAEQAAKSQEMQSPKVFDTKQYHLPIDEGVAGGKGKYLMVFLIVLLLVAAFGAVAIDAEWIDVGFDLPFDLIK